MSTPQESPSLTFGRRYWPVVLLALLPLIPLYRAVFLGEAIGPFDQIRQMAPWKGAKPGQPWDVLQADGVLQFYVWRDLVFEAWGKGQLPFWNSYQLAGAPLMGNSQSGALYPPHMIMGLLHVPTATAMTLLAWFHLFWAGLGTYAFCRTLGASRMGAYIGGSCFALSTFMIAWTGLPSVIETVAWIPWALAGVMALFEQTALIARLQRVKPPTGSDATAARRVGAGLLAGLALSIAMMVLAGHLQFVAYGAFAVGLFLVWLIATRQDAEIGSQKVVSEMKPAAGSPPPAEPELKRSSLISKPSLVSTLKVVIAGVLGLCIAAPQLLTVLQYSQFSHRRNVPTEDGYKAYLGGAIQPYELVKMVVPSIEGNPRQFATEQAPLSTYYPSLLKVGANFAESAIGIGAFALILLCFLPLLAKLRDPVWGAVLFGAVGFLIALGTPLNHFLYFGIPGWSSTGSPGRAICLFVLAACIGSALAVTRLENLKHMIGDRAPQFPFAIGAFVLILGCVAWLKNSYVLPKGLTPEMLGEFKTQAESGAFSSGIGITLLTIMAVLLATYERKLRSKALLALVPVLTCLAFFGTTLIQTGTPNLKIDSSLGMERIAAINPSWSLFQTPKTIIPPNLAALNRIHSLDGYDSLLHRDTVALLNDVDGEGAAPPENGNMMLIKPGADFKKLADAGVTEVWSQKEIPSLGVPNQDGGILKYRLSGPGRASTPQGPARIESETFSQIKLHASGPGKLVLRDRNMPGWMPKIDGSHASLGGTTWMEVELPAGEHEIEMNYVPPGFMTGVLLAIPSWIIVFLLAFRSFLLARVGRTAS